MAAPVIWPTGTINNTALTGSEKVTVDTPSPQIQQTPVLNLVNFAGSSALTASVSATSNTTLAASGLSANLAAGGVYTFRVYLSVTNGSSGGLKIAPGGTATATTFCADAWGYNTTTLTTQANITALSSNYIANTASYTAVIIEGAIVVNAGGTFTLRYAQNGSNGTATTLNAGSFMTVQRIA